MATQLLPNQNTSKQRALLEAVIATAEAARTAADRGLLFADRKGAALMDALHDLTELGEVYDLADQVRYECGMDPKEATLPTLRPITIQPVQFRGA